MVKVSVLMPVYNTEEKYLRDAMESILNQSFKNFEFLIYDDGSTNNASEIIKSYKDKRIQYISNPQNLGLIKTLNNGLSIAKGEYIARMDSDDISLPTRIEKQVAFMDNNPTVGICGTAIEFFPDNRELKFPEYPKVLDLLFGSILAHPSVIFRKSEIEKYKWHYDERYIHCEDFALWSQAIRQTSIYNLQEVLLKYRWHGKNISVLRAEEQKNTAEEIKKEILKTFISNEEQINQIRERCSTHKVVKSFCGIKWLKITYSKMIKIYFFGVCILKIKRI